MYILSLIDYSINQWEKVDHLVHNISSIQSGFLFPFPLQIDTKLQLQTH